MKRIFIFLAVLAFYQTSLEAICFKPDCSCWSGFYFGGNIGGAGCSTQTVRRGSFSPGFEGTITFGNNVPKTFHLKPAGFVGGGQIGYNLQLCHFVVGVEADLQKTVIRGRDTIELPGAPGFAPSVSKAKTDLEWLATVRGRAGYSFCRTFLYLTAGLAYCQIKNSASLVFNPTTSGNFHGHKTTSQKGLTAGAGVEVAFLRCMSAKLEYLHVRLESSTVTLTDPAQFSTNFLNYRFKSPQANIVRTGLNFHF